MKVKFKGKILVIGCGFVSRCTLPLLLKHIDLPSEKITVMDFADFGHHIKEHTTKGVRFVKDRVTEKNMASKLNEYVGDGDMIIDLAWNIDCLEILQWCHDHNVLYINTSVELWDPYAGAKDKAPTERTLYVRHMAIKEMVNGWKNKKERLRYSNMAPIPASFPISPRWRSPISPKRSSRASRRTSASPN